MELQPLGREMLAEHDELRNRLAHIRRLAISIEKGERVADAEERLRAHLGGLRDALLEHIRREDFALFPLLRGDEAWGEQRVNLLEQEHAAEHKVILAAMQEARAMRGPRRLAAAARMLARELTAHLEEEEVYLLAPELLRER
jgi:iron-sulfur cluster repair protein YtfE (RIC family)